MHMLLAAHMYDGGVVAEGDTLISLVQSDQCDFKRRCQIADSGDHALFEMSQFDRVCSPGWINEWRNPRLVFQKDVLMVSF